jgi:hypothetical protein
MNALQWNPHEYQLRAIEGMVSKPGFALFAEPGLGKTSTTLASYLTLKEASAANANMREFLNKLADMWDQPGAMPHVWIRDGIYELTGRIV